MALTKNHFRASIRFPIIFIILIWLIKVLEISLDQNWASFGIYPRHLTGILGILLAPLLHGDIQHLLSNTFPLLVLFASIFYFYNKIAWKVFLVSYLFVGIWVWVLARENYHIGASGLIYSFFGFLVFSGILRKQRALLTISLITIFLYGSIIWGIFPQGMHISWEGHLFGLFTGIAIAYYYKDIAVNVGNKNDRISEDQEYTRDFWNDVIEK